MEKYVRKLQLVELEILKEINRICKNNNINYFLSGGTLLGSIRHKGFIPWDDDIDIAMTRKNYNKFIEACKKELDDKYFIDCYKTNKKCYIPFIKIKKKNTLYVENKYFDNYNEQNCIWVDVFPLDGARKKEDKITFRQHKISKYISTLITIKNGSNYYKNSMIKKKIYGFFLKFVPMKFMSFLYDKTLSWFDEDKVDYLVSFCTVYTLKQDTFNKKKLLPYNDVEFEGEKFMGIKGYDYYLTQMYGDYMTLPPKDQRNGHHPYLIKFEDGEEIKFE